MHTYIHILSLALDESGEVRSACRHMYRQIDRRTDRHVYTNTHTQTHTHTHAHTMTLHVLALALKQLHSLSLH